MSLTSIKTHPLTGLEVKQPNSREEEGQAKELLHILSKSNSGRALECLFQTIFDITRGYDLDLIDNFKTTVHELMTVISKLYEDGEYNGLHGAGHALFLLHGIGEFLQLVSQNPVETAMYKWVLENFQSKADVHFIALRLHSDRTGMVSDKQKTSTDQLIEDLSKIKL